MHIVVIFTHIGNYHLARLQAAAAQFQTQGWTLTALQVTDTSSEHPWGDLSAAVPFKIETLLPAATTDLKTDRRPDTPIAAKLIGSSLEALQPDVVAIPGWGFHVSRSALRWCRQRRIPTIVMSESKENDEPRVWWKEWLKSRLYVRQFNAALVGGQLHHDYLMGLGLPNDRIFRGYNAVDNAYFAQQATWASHQPMAARQRQPIPSRPYFLSATRLIPRKNVKRLIEAFIAYRHEVGDGAWDLVICGNGSETASIQELIQQQQIQNYVHLPGFVTYQDIGDWYGLANAFVHPPLHEQWGLVVNEAAAAGLPLLCSRAAGASELVQEQSEQRNGFVFEPTSIPDMTQALLAMHHLDAQTRCRYGQNSQAIVAHYSAQSFADGLTRAAQTALNSIPKP
jgi:1,2-diacylglycerol 3-alpha-glucosyltransferase